MKDTLRLQPHGPGNAVKNLWSYLSLVHPARELSADADIAFPVRVFSWLEMVG